LKIGTVLENKYFYIVNLLGAGISADLSYLHKLLILATFSSNGESCVVVMVIWLKFIMAGKRVAALDLLENSRFLTFFT
jgi:hypothetical protein